ncbi:hypothetical protein C7821_1261, partial [Streptomyces sp. VMFN-G11Ma]
ATNTLSRTCYQATHPTIPLTTTHCHPTTHSHPL